MTFKFNKITITLFSLFCINSLSIAQNKSLAQIQYEAIYGPIKEEKAEEKPKGKYDHLPLDQKQRYEEIDRQNAELISKNPQDYIEKPKPQGIIADPTSGAFIQPTIPQNSILNTPHQINKQSMKPSMKPSMGNSSYRSAFSAIRHRSISDLVTSWSGKEGQYLIWNYSKDYTIYNPSAFNQETKLNEALGLDDALQKIFRYIASKEASDPKHLPPQLCYEGNTLLVVDINVDC